MFLSIFTFIAQADPFGKIAISGIPTGIEGGKLTGIMVFFNTILRLVFAGAGIWALINIILAGFGYINASGDPKALSAAWAKIWQSFIGLLIIVSSFLVAAIMGLLFFKDAGAILNPQL